ncbi:MAG: metallophosphoesterase [Acidimicrobiales bacterium]
MAPRFPFTGLSPVEVFARDDTSVQLTWRGLGDHAVSAVVEGREVALGDGTAGVADVAGLEADRLHLLDVGAVGRAPIRIAARTEPSLDGPELIRIATISDLHLGERSFGLFRSMREPGEPMPSYPLRCARHAVREAIAWGAQLLVIKGDITDDGQPGEWDLFDELLEEITIPVLAVPGNHDTFGHTGALDAVAELDRRGLYDGPVRHADLPGVRIVAVDSPTPTQSHGRLRVHEAALTGAVDTDRPALVFTHHHVEQLPVTTFWPPGTPRRDGRSSLDRLVEANPNLLFSSGHTHRNRARRHGPALVTEVSATKDHPGVWAGYVVHPGGIRQVVRRVAEPSCVAWNDRTHAAVGGIWGRWTPGSLAERSITHLWPVPERIDAQSSKASPDREWPRRSRLVSR